jgi:hypothetical protein
MGINPASSAMVEGVDREEEPESFRSALAVIKDLRDEIEHWEVSYKSACDDCVELHLEIGRAAALLDALRVIDLQVLPEHIAKLVAEWKAS